VSARTTWPEIGFSEGFRTVASAHALRQPTAVGPSISIITSTSSELIRTG